MEKILTILTPTFNRGFIIKKLYFSLLNQTNKNFEWIVIDDGSTDNTKELINLWISENILDIKYFYQPNGGKHRALNFGVRKSKGKYIYILDSDDQLVKNSINKIFHWLSSIHGLNNFAGVSGLRGTNSFERIGLFPKGKHYVDATNLERISKKLIGDKAEIYNRDILLKYRFPEFIGENFLYESVVWNQIALDGYKIRWFNEIIQICNYLSDGLTKTNDITRQIKNFKGYTLYEYYNFIGLNFPYNFLSLGRYISLAKKTFIKGIDIRKKFKINFFQYFLGYFIFMIHKLGKIK